MTYVRRTEHRTYARWTVGGEPHAVSTDDDLRGGVWHTAALARDAELSESWVEDVARGGQLQLSVARLPAEEKVILDELDDPLLDESGSPLLTESPAYTSLTLTPVEGLQVTIETLTRVDYTDDSSQEFARIATLTCTGRTRSPGLVTLTLQDIEDQKLNALYPPRLYAAADWPLLREEDAGRAVPRPFGTALKLQGALVSSGPAWRYVLADLTDVGAGTVLTVYRGRTASEGRVVDPAEYTVGTDSTPWPHLWVQFTREQRDFNGAPFVISADVQAVAADVIASQPLCVVLRSAGAVVDAGSELALGAWATAQGRLVSCDFGRAGQRTVRAIAEDLLAVLCATTYRLPDGSYGFREDGPGAPLASYDEDAGDAIEILGIEERARVASVSVAYRPSPQDPAKLQAVQTREVDGGSLGDERPRQLGYLRTGVAADRVALHRAQRTALNTRLRVRVYRALHEVGEVIELASNAWGLDRSEWRVRESTAIVGGCELTCTPYSDSLWTYVPGTVPADAAADYSPDFSSTPPAAPSGLRVTATGVSTQTDGVLVARVTADVLPPAVNWAAIWLAAVHNVTGEITLTRAEDVGGGRYGATLTGLRPGEVYQLLCYAVNAFSIKGAVQATFNATAIGGGAADTLLNTAGLATLPPTVVSISAIQIPPRSVDVRWAAVNLANLREYVVERNANSTSWVEVWRGRALTWVDRDVVYFGTYQYRVRARDTWGNFSAAYATSVTISLVGGTIFGGVSGNDIGPSTVATANRTNISTVAAGYGLVTIVGFSLSIPHGLGRVPIAVANTNGKAGDWVNVGFASAANIAVTVYRAPNQPSPDFQAPANPHQHLFFYPGGAGTISVDIW